MYNVSAHKLTQYYQPEWIPAAARTALWNTCCKLAHTRNIEKLCFAIVLKVDNKMKS